MKRGDSRAPAPGRLLFDADSTSDLQGEWPKKSHAGMMKWNSAKQITSCCSAKQRQYRYSSSVIPLLLL